MTQDIKWLVERLRGVSFRSGLADSPSLCAEAADALTTLAAEQSRPSTNAVGREAIERDLPRVCDGKEQEAFEAEAKKRGARALWLNGQTSIDDTPASRYLAASALEGRAAEAIRKSFFTSVSQGAGKGYHLSLAYASMQEMHDAEDAIKAWAKSALETRTPTPPATDDAIAAEDAEIAELREASAINELFDWIIAHKASVLDGMSRREREDFTDLLGHARFAALAPSTDRGEAK